MTWVNASLRSSRVRAFTEDLRFATPSSCGLDRRHVCSSKKRVDTSCPGNGNLSVWNKGVYGSKNSILFATVPFTLANKRRRYVPALCELDVKQEVVGGGGGEGKARRRKEKRRA